MSDEEDRAPVGGIEHVGDERLRRRFIEVRRGLVEEEDGRIGEERPGDDEPLALSAGEPHPVLPDEGVEPVGKARDPLVEPRAAEAPRSSSSVASGRASLRFSRMVESNTCASWPASANMRRTSSCRSSRASRPPIVTRPSSGSRNRRRRFVTVVFPAPLGPTSATRFPGSSRRSKPLEGRKLLRRVAGRHSFQRDRDIA